METEDLIWDVRHVSNPEQERWLLEQGYEPFARTFFRGQIPRENVTTLSLRRLVTAEERNWLDEQMNPQQQRPTREPRHPRAARTFLFSWLATWVLIGPIALLAHPAWAGGGNWMEPAHYSIAALIGIGLLVDLAWPIVLFPVSIPLVLLLIWIGHLIATKRIARNPL